VYFAAALLIVDGLIALGGGLRSADMRQWLLVVAATAGTALAIETARWAWAFWTLTPDQAWDVVWPQYTLELYRAMPPEMHFPRWLGVRVFLAQQLLPLTGLTCAVAVLVWHFVTGGTRNLDRQADFALLLAPLFYVIGIGTYLGHVYVYPVYS